MSYEGVSSNLGCLLILTFDTSYGIPHTVSTQQVAPLLFIVLAFGANTPDCKSAFPRASSFHWNAEKMDQLKHVYCFLVFKCKDAMTPTFHCKNNVKCVIAVGFFACAFLQIRRL